MNSVIRILLASFSLFATCLVLHYYVQQNNHAMETDKQIIEQGDTLSEELLATTDFEGYTKASECIEESCLEEPLACSAASHLRVTYLTKEIKGAEVLRLVYKYQHDIGGNIIIRTDKISRYVNKLYQFRNQILNIDYVEPSDTFVAKILMSKGKPYTMYFQQKGYQFIKSYDVVNDKYVSNEIEPLYFRPGMHSASAFVMLTESMDYTLPKGKSISNIKSIRFYACASGNGGNCGQAITGLPIQLTDGKYWNGKTLNVRITYKGNTTVKCDNKVLFDLETHYVANELIPTCTEPEGFSYGDSYSQEMAQRLFGFTTGVDGEDYLGSTEYYFMTNGVLSAENSIGGGSDGAAGGKGGVYGYGGGAGATNYLVRYKNSNGTPISLTQIAAQGGSYASGDGVHSESILDRLNLSSSYFNLQLRRGGSYSRLMAGSGGIVPNNDDRYGAFATSGPTAMDNNRWDTMKDHFGFIAAEDGNKATLFNGGSGGLATLISYDGEGTGDFTYAAAAGGGGAGGGYGAGGGENGFSNVSPSGIEFDSSANNYGDPSSGMVYMVFETE